MNTEACIALIRVVLAPLPRHERIAWMRKHMPRTWAMLQMKQGGWDSLGDKA